MSDKAFVDSNVSIYLYSEDDLEKAAKAKSLFEQGPS